MARTVHNNYTSPVISIAKCGKIKTTSQSIIVTREFDLEEQQELEADARLWTNTFNAMTPEQFAKLDELFGDDDEETFPLDFSAR